MVSETRARIKKESKVSETAAPRLGSKMNGLPNKFQDDFKKKNRRPIQDKTFQTSFKLKKMKKIGMKCQKICKNDVRNLS